MNYTVNNPKHLFVVALVGIGLILLIAMAGCGSVDLVTMDAQPDTIGITPDGGAAGTTGAAGTGFADGGAGTTGAAGIGTTGAAGTVGEPCVGEGTSCGVTMCSGMKDVMGFPGGSNVYASSDARVCRAGRCVVETTSCRAMVCPATCKLQYKGCVTDSCWCVGTDGSICQ